MSDLRILPVKELPKPEPKRKLNPLIPELPALGIQVGGVKQGKSNFGLNWWFSKSFFGDYFPTNYMISPTLYADEKNRFFLQDDDWVTFDDYDDSIIQGIIKSQMSFPEKERPEVSLYADDIIGTIPQRNNVFYSFLTKFRHYNVKLVFINSQSFRSIPKVARTNATFFILRRYNNSKEVESMEEEFGSAFGSPKIFRERYLEATKEPFSFCYLRMDTSPPQMWRNFEEQIYPMKGDIHGDDKKETE